MKRGSRIEELARLVHPRDGHRKIFAMIDAYLDESGIHDNAAVCVIAGFFGGISGWKTLESRWEPILKNHHVALDEFHAKDFVKRQRYAPLLNELTTLISGLSKIHPVCFSIDVNDFNSLSYGQRKFMTGAIVKHRKMITSGCPSKPYFVPFQLCIKNVCDSAPIGGKAHFFFGLDKPFAGYATELFAQTKSDEYAFPESDWKTKDRLGDPSFPLAKETPQLQAADLFVHLAYQFYLKHREDDSLLMDRYSPLLTRCICNLMVKQDIGHQNRQQLIATLLNGRKTLGKDWLSEFNEGLPKE